MDRGLSEAELLDRARAERAAIVSKYERGRTDDEGSEVIAPPWEDPQFEDYHVTDKWGFIHDTRLPEIHTKEEERNIEVESNRMLKWKKMAKGWDKYHGEGVKHRADGIKSKGVPAHYIVSDKLYNRIYKGIPPSFRGWVWQQLMNVMLIKKQQPGKYQQMKSLGCQWSPDVRQIDLDINRTFRDNIMFRKRFDVKQQQLFFVLVAYSVYNQEVGYCQGMSQIAALLLMYMDEEDAFWGLSALMADTKYNMHGFFIPGFPKLLRFQDIHRHILSSKLPNLNKHLNKNCIDAGLYTLKWFFQCYLDRVPFPLCLRLWDVYLLEGDSLLLAAGYTILKLHRRAIQLLDMDSILDFMQKRLSLDFGFPEDEFIQSVRKSLEELRKSKQCIPKAPPTDELPALPFGTFIPPSLSQEVGVRETPDSKEKHLTQQLIEKQEEMRRKSVLQGSTESLDRSIDDVSSAGVSRSVTVAHSTADTLAGSRVSLDTSLTSAPDLSTLSSLTLGKRVDTDQTSLVSSSNCQLLSPLRSPSHLNTSSSDHHVNHLKLSEKKSDEGKTEEVSRRSVYSDSGCYNVEETNGVSHSDSEEETGKLCRPSKLSVSQSTLIRDCDFSGPVTPKASGDTPDTVRLYVPYSQETDHQLISTCELINEDALQGNLKDELAVVNDVTNVNNSLDTSQKVVNSFPTLQISSTVDANESSKAYDANKIKLRIDGDNISRGGNSLPNSPRDLPHSPHIPKKINSDLVNQIPTYEYSETSRSISKDIPTYEFSSQLSELSQKSRTNNGSASVSPPYSSKINSPPYSSKIDSPPHFSKVDSPPHFSKVDSPPHSNMPPQLPSPKDFPSNDVYLRKSSPRDSPSNDVYLRKSSPRDSPSNDVYLRKSSPKDSPSNDVYFRKSSPRDSPNNDVYLRKSSPKDSPSNDVYFRKSSPKDSPSNDVYFRKSSPRDSPNNDVYLRKSSSRDSPIQVMISTYYESKHHIAHPAKEHFSFDGRVQQYNKNRRSTSSHGSPSPTASLHTPTDYSSSPSKNNRQSSDHFSNESDSGPLPVSPIEKLIASYSTTEQPVAPSVTTHYPNFKIYNSAHDLENSVRAESSSRSVRADSSIRSVTQKEYKQSPQPTPEYGGFRPLPPATAPKPKRRE